MMRERDELLRVFQDPTLAHTLSPAQWTRVIGTARDANVLGKLAALLEGTDSMPPGNPARHLRGALQLSQRQQQSVLWEAHQIDGALAQLNIKVVLLKGAAYSLAKLPAGTGRLFGDVDILVPRESLGQVEVRLMTKGWTGLKNDDYDQRFYRELTHELPPMIHPRRGTVIDVHHTILPPTARHRPSPDHILQRAEPLPGMQCLHVPSTQDLVIHSLCHLVHEGEVNNTLRDLHDIATLLNMAASAPDFPAALVDAAREHDLIGPTCLGLQLVNRYFPAPQIDICLARFRELGPHVPRWLLATYDKAIEPNPTSTRSAGAQCAQFALYIRSHALRMPAGMLLRHLSKKAWRRLTER